MIHSCIYVFNADIVSADRACTKFENQEVLTSMLQILEVPVVHADMYDGKFKLLLYYNAGHSYITYV